jgi:cytochrome c553
MNMVNSHFPTIFGALVIFATGLAGPSAAADEIDATKVQICGTCHGSNGVPTDPKTIPIIWGQQQNFLMKQLHDYHAGDRDNPVMAAMAKTLKQEDLRPAAAFFASKAWPAGHPAATPASAAPANMTVCQVCHQQGFVGGAPAPRLAGQSYEYLIKQMNDFANGTRTNSMDMGKIMSELSQADRETMAHYIAGL